MFESRYSKILTIILIIIIVAIVGLLIFLGFDYYQKYFVTQEASNFVENFNSNIVFNETNNDNSIVEENNNSNTEITNNIIINGLNETPSVSSGGSSSSSSNKKYNGYTVAGTIVIPTINVNYPILEEMSTGALQQAIVLLYPTAKSLNKPGNVVLVGHNYRNGLFFSNVKKLKNGDKIYITDNSGIRKEYTVYNKFEASDTDTSFYQRDTNGVSEITLSTCTDANNDQRTIVFAKATN